MQLTILSVGFPFAPVSDGAAGGAEQILALLDHGIREAGHKSIVLAGSAAAIGNREAAWAKHREAIARVLRTAQVDLVHMHGLDFDRYLPEPGVPVIVTLHLPAAWYPPGVFRLTRPETHLVCVSRSQRLTCPPGLPVRVVENGVPVDRLPARISRRNFVFALGRVCPEKGFHMALEASERAGVPLMLGGEVYAYPEHEAYFQSEIVPRLGGARKFLGPVDFERKRRLLTAARAVLIPSLAAETSSLVAMEALACGTPVIALPNGALPEIVEHGKTGFLVKDAREMAEAILHADEIDRERCRRAARERFSSARMTGEYLELYHRVVNACAAVGN